MVGNLLGLWASPRLVLPWRLGLHLGKELAAEETNDGTGNFSV